MSTLREKFLHKKDPLLGTREVLSYLGLNSKDKVWSEIKTRLVKEYGMRYMPGGGYRILASNFQNYLTFFLSENGKKNFFN